MLSCWAIRKRRLSEREGHMVRYYRGTQKKPLKKNGKEKEAQIVSKEKRPAAENKMKARPLEDK